jgi:hypothetical protein
LVFNLGEICISDWEDHKTKKIVVAAAMFGQPIHHGVCPNVKHIIVMICMSAVGQSHRPYMVISQDSSPVQRHLERHGVHFERDLILKSRQRPYINADIVLNHIMIVILPDFVEHRDLTQFAEEITIILIQNCFGSCN